MGEITKGHLSAWPRTALFALLRSSVNCGRSPDEMMGILRFLGRYRMIMRVLSIFDLISRLQHSTVDAGVCYPFGRKHGEDRQ